MENNVNVVIEKRNEKEELKRFTGFIMGFRKLENQKEKKGENK